MELYQFSTALVALTCAAMFILAARATRDRVARILQLLWAVVMLIAATNYLIILFTDLDASALSISRVLTPLGWGALAILAARRIARRDK